MWAVYGTVLPPSLVVFLKVDHTSSPGLRIYEALALICTSHSFSKNRFEPVLKKRKNKKNHNFFHQSTSVVEVTQAESSFQRSSILMSRLFTNLRNQQQTKLFPMWWTMTFQFLITTVWLTGRFAFRFSEFCKISLNAK